MTTTWDTLEKPGTGLTYDNENTYDQADDTVTGLSLSYDSVGVGASWGTESKS